MPTWTWIVLLLMAALTLLLSLWAAWRSGSAGGALQQALREDAERLERELRDEMSRAGLTARQDLAALQNLLLTQAQNTRESQEAAMRHFGGVLAEQLRQLADGNERRLTEVRTAVEQRLAALQEGNERKLEQMRATVDEKLHATLEQRLGESFRQVADRLEQVHQGLGEMRTLARDVGSLSRVLGNVKTRGVFGELQLTTLLDEVLTPEQYAMHVITVPGSNERVEVAIKLPGQRADGSVLWLPIDAKFPREDYERLLEAHEQADAAGAEAAARSLENRLKLEARTIRDKYVAPPNTTDFAILFLPAEGLYAEALRRPGLFEQLQRDFKVMLAGPTTLLATLNSLQMGFRTLALERRSAEVWEVLGAVRTEFRRFGEALAKTRKKLEEATSTIDAAQTRGRAVDRRLRSVEALPEDHATRLLPGFAPGDEDPTGE